MVFLETYFEKNQSDSNSAKYSKHFFHEATHNDFYIKFNWNLKKKQVATYI